MQIGIKGHVVGVMLPSEWMPAPLAPWVPLALGSVAARGAAGLYRYADSHYIRDAPHPPSTSAPVAMAKRTFSRTRTTTRRRYKRRRLGRIRRRIPRVLVPRSKIVRLKTVYAQKAFTSTSGALAMVPVSLFNITDPWVGNSSLQPLGYDQWKVLFNKAFVVGLKVTVRVHNEGTVGVMFGVSPMPESQGGTGLTQYNHYMELPQTASRILSPEMDHAVLVSKVGTARHVGVRKLRDEDQFHVTLAAETQPARDAYVHIWCQPIDQETTNNVELVVTAEYLVVLYDPVIPARSYDT